MNGEFPGREPLVSVLTPVYNGEADLRECIESVLAQTYAHWDYTIVDNCSTDRTRSIAQEYAEKDSRIHVVTNETCVRAVENHNIAFRRISPLSTYCKVVQADDCLLPECLGKMVAVAEAHPAVAIVGSYGMVGSEVACVGIPYPTTVMSGREVARMRLLGGPYVFGSPTSVLYRSDIVRSRHAFYNESNIHADAEACFEFLQSRDFGFVHQVLTFIRRRPESLTSFSMEFNTYLPEMLYNLVRYGPAYLDGGELQPRIEEVLRQYHRYLGREAFHRRGPEFWKFHRERLASLGHPLRTPRLAAAAASHALGVVLNPARGFQAAAYVLRRMFAGRGRSRS
jgi:glycosyltransferase involved in cell wall biosynthesis